MRLAVIFSLLASGIPALAQQGPASCQRDVDCPGELVCEHNRCVAAQPVAPGCRSDAECKAGRSCVSGQCVEGPATVPTPAGSGTAPSAPGYAPSAPTYAPSAPVAAAESSSNAVGPPPSRFAIIFQPNFPLTGSALKFNSTLVNFGADLSVPIGYNGARYHLGLMYTTVGDLFGGRLEPLQFGWSIPLYKQDALSIEVEPQVSFPEVQFLAGAGDAAFFFGPGADVQVTATWQRFFFLLQPVGADVRIFGVELNRGHSNFDAAFEYRLRFGAGIQF